MRTAQITCATSRPRAPHILTTLQIFAPASEEEVAAEETRQVRSCGRACSWTSDPLPSCRAARSTGALGGGGARVGRIPAGGGGGGGRAGAAVGAGVYRDGDGHRRAPRARPERAGALRGQAGGRHCVRLVVCARRADRLQAEPGGHCARGTHTLTRPCSNAAHRTCSSRTPTKPSQASNTQARTCCPLAPSPPRFVVHHIR